MDNYKELISLRQKVDSALDGYFTAPCTQKRLLDAMRYSLLAGGKRIRPILLLKFCQAAGGDMEKAMPAACAVEMLHTYSLIHDDLPCMDNDELRRGMPTNHVVYGECTATLAGDALQAAAFHTLLSSGLDDYARAEMGRVFALAVGEMGMCGGQMLDTAETGEEQTVERLTEISRLKTGALLRAACVMGVLAAGCRADDKRVKAASEYAACLGLAFQIRDDVLDAESTTETLGKPVGSDVQCGKVTFYSLLGSRECARLIAGYTAAAKAALKEGFGDAPFLEWLADELAGRTK